MSETPPPEEPPRARLPPRLHPIGTVLFASMVAYIGLVPALFALVFAAGMMLLLHRRRPALVAWIGVLQVRHGAMTPGDLLVFTSYLSSLYKPICRLARSSSLKLLTTSTSTGFSSSK